MKYTKVETVELEDDYEGQHVALDLACGVFDLIGDEAVQAAETACGGREPGMVKREHRARVPGTDGLVEGRGFLQKYIQGRMAVSSELRDIQDIHKTARRQRSRSNRRAETRTSNMLDMSVTPDVQDVTRSAGLPWTRASN